MHPGFPVSHLFFWCCRLLGCFEGEDGELGDFTAQGTNGHFCFTVPMLHQLVEPCRHPPTMVYNPLQSRPQTKEDSEAMYRHVLDVREKTLGPQHANTLRAKANLAEAWQHETAFIAWKPGKCIMNHAAAFSKIHTKEWCMVWHRMMMNDVHTWGFAFVSCTA